MKAELRTDPTHVPLTGGEDVEITPGQPWPSAYRGSKYSFVESPRGESGTVVKWEYEDITLHRQPPKGLLNRMREVGKSSGSGRGSFRITAEGEVLTKVHADDYPKVDQAPVSEGWIPVYLGRIDGQLEFAGVDNDPSRLNGSDIAVWDGFPSNHGEEWVVSGRKKLIWKWDDYRFQSAFDHSELVSRYQKFRQPAGRLHVNEHGHVFVNVNPAEIPPATKDTVLSIYDRWRETTEKTGNTAAGKLVDRRLRATTRTDDPQDGLLPMYLGHLEEFDDGRVPRPVVDDPEYFLACGRRETHAKW